MLNSILLTALHRTNKYVPAALLIGCLGFCGCAATHDQGNLTGGDQSAKPDAARDGAGQIEVVEANYPDGGVKQRVEGKKDAEGNFINHGLLTNYYETGEKLSQMSFLEGARHGPKHAWYRDGQLWNDGRYIHGKADGVWTEWLPNGIKGREMHFDNGAIHGMMTEWHSNGKKKMELMYVRGQRQGRMTYWNKEGAVIRQVDYVDDVAQP